MIQLKSKLVVSVEFEGGEATFTFKYPRVNKIKRYSTEADAFERASIILSELIEVSGLQDETGKQITVDEAKALDIPVNLLWAIVAAYTSAAIKELQGEEEPKNESTASA